MTNVRDFGATGDGQTDDTPAFLAALSSIDSRTISLPGLTLHGGGVLDVPDGVYRLAADLPLHQRTRIRAAGASLVFSSGGVVLDSGYTQAQAEVEIDGGAWYSTHGGRGFDARGGGYSLITRSTWAGWDTAWHLEASNGITVRDCIASAWPGMGTLSGVGVRFALRPSLGGGATNGNVVERVQFNGRSIAIHAEDGQGNAVRDCNINAPIEVLRVEGAISLTVERCQAEGVTGDCYVRLGSPGYTVARIVAQQLAIVGCAFSRNEPHQPAIVRMEVNAQAWDVSLDRTHVLTAAAGAMIQCAAPWPTIPYVMIRGLSRRGLLVAGSSLGTLRPVVTDRDLYGLDGGP